MSYIDTHLHLSSPEYKEDIGALISRARDAGVRFMITIGSGYGAQNFSDACQIAEKYDLFFASGVHPHDADLGLGITEIDNVYEERLKCIFGELRVYAQNRRMVGLGEIGLDFYYNHSPRNIQKETFCRFLEFSKEIRMPVVIHSRDAFRETIDIIKSVQPLVCGGVFHCFSGDREQARDVLELGFYISISGIVTFKKAEIMRDVVKYMPKDRLLVETDAPFLAPVPYRGKRNEPAFIVETYKAIALLKGIDVNNLAEIIRRNTMNCFRIGEGDLI